MQRPYMNGVTIEYSFVRILGRCGWRQPPAA